MQTECRFSLAVMSGDYAAMIVNAVRRADTGRISCRTDALSTTYRGRRGDVADAVRSCFFAANDRRTHITLEAAFYGGGTEPEEEAAALSQRAVPGDSFPVLAKYAAYPLGTVEFTPHITHIEGLAKDMGIFKAPSFYGADIYGDETRIFDFLREAMAYLERETGRYALHVTLSVNSPSKL
jgi:hypothetical protein